VKRLIGRGQPGPKITQLKGGIGYMTTHNIFYELHRRRVRPHRNDLWAQLCDGDQTVLLLLPLRRRDRHWRNSSHLLCCRECIVLSCVLEIMTDSPPMCAIISSQAVLRYKRLGNMIHGH
jgi:hypothetical protein